jgi:AraC-like DNA-binding protein
MNYIIKCGNSLSAISNQVEAATHKHWMVQLFMSQKERLQIKVGNENLSCQGILIDMDTKHKFNTGDEIHFTMLLNPTSELVRRIRTKYFKEKPYYILPEEQIKGLLLYLEIAIQNRTRETMSKLVHEVWNTFEDNSPRKSYDSRIEQLFLAIDASEGNNAEQKVSDWAKKWMLSPSRLAHIFKEQTQIPLKSYLVLHKLWNAYDVIFDGGSITKAAMEAGFASSAHLAYTNKKMTGMSAKEIMKDSEFLKVDV